MQQGDVVLYQTSDGGEINVADGFVEMSGGLETAAYLSLFGGNEDDDGRKNNAFSWWGNLGETDPARKYRSETQNLLQSLPATTGNLRRVEDAARSDLAWLIQHGIAASIDVLVTVPDVNKIKLIITIEADGEASRIAFLENWKASA